MSDDFELNYPQDEEEKDSFISKFGKVIGLIFAPIMMALGFMPRKARIIVTIVGITALLIFILGALQPKAQKRKTPDTIVKVEVVEATRSEYPIVVNTNGTIQADTRGGLVSQIRGEIVKVSDNFKNGGAFEAGDVLIEVDQRDYLAEVSQALSAVSQAKASLEQEQALAKQAKTDWERLGNTGPAPALVARKPQSAAARAQLESANARYQTAKLNLERTKIKAPYTGRVINRNAVLGQYVGVGTQLAEVFATQGVEVRLPVSQIEYTQLGLDQLGTDQAQQFKVTITSKLGSNSYAWDAFVTRADSTFDLTTRQIDVIAEVVDPFSKDGSQPPLKIGQFVNASIQGKTLNNVITVPNKSLREGSYVFTSQDGILVRSPVALLWQDDKNAVIEQGLEDGDIVVTTSLNSTLAGAKVKFDQSQIASTPAEELILEENTDVTDVAPVDPIESAISAEGESSGQSANDGSGEVVTAAAAVETSDAALEENTEQVIVETVSEADVKNETDQSNVNTPAPSSETNATSPIGQ